MKRFSLFFLLVCLHYAVPAWGLDNVLPAPNDKAFVYFTADKATVEPDSKKVNLSGNVTVIQKTPDGKKRVKTFHWTKPIHKLHLSAR